MTVGTHQLVEGVNKWGILRGSWVGLLVKSGDSYLDLQSVTEIHAQVALSTCCFSLARLSPGCSAMPMPTVFWMGQNRIGPLEQQSASLGQSLCSLFPPWERLWAEEFLLVPSYLPHGELHEAGKTTLLFLSSSVWLFLDFWFHWGVGTSHLGS